MDVNMQHHGTPLSLPLSLAKGPNLSQMSVQASPYRPSESLLLQLEGDAVSKDVGFAGMDAYLPEFAQDSAQVPHLGGGNLFPDLKVPELLLDDFFAFNLPNMLASQTSTPAPTTLVNPPQQGMQPLNPMALTQETVQATETAGGVSGKKKKHKRPRNSFNELQKKVLDDFFDQQTHTPTRNQKLQLASQLNSSERTVTVWFQNRRQKLVKLARGETSPKEPKLIGLKTHKIPSTPAGVSKKKKAMPGHYLSPPTLPTESPLPNAYLQPPPQFVVMPPHVSSPQAPNMMPYNMFNGQLLDPSRYMLSPVTPTFNQQYAMFQQMRNMQLTTPPPLMPPVQPTPELMLEYPNPLFLNPHASTGPTPNDFLNYQHSLLQPPNMQPLMQDASLLGKAPFMVTSQTGATIPIDPSISSLAVPSQDKVKNATSI